MVKNYYRYASIVLAMAVLLVVGGCATKPESEPPLANQSGQTELAPDIDELLPEEEPWGLSQPIGRTGAAAFEGTDFLTGGEVEFSPGESDMPAIVSFFSPG